MFAWLVAGLLTVGCADKTNPVIPSTGGPGGVAAGGGSDGGGASDSPVSSEVELVASDATAGRDSDATAGRDSDASSDACDLLTYVLTQTGCLPSQACYPDPVSGAGRCQNAGSSQGGSCVVGEDQPSCDKGYACIPLDITITTGSCLPLCDFSNQVPVCRFGNACHLLWGSTSVGYCQSA